MQSGFVEKVPEQWKIISLSTSGFKTSIFSHKFSICTIILPQWDYDGYVLYLCNIVGLKYVKWWQETLHHDWNFLLWNNTHTFHKFLPVTAICRLCTLTLLCHKTCPNVILRHHHASGDQECSKMTELTEQNKKQKKVNYRTNTFCSLIRHVWNC